MYGAAGRENGNRALEVPDNRVKPYRGAEQIEAGTDEQRIEDDE